MASKLEKLLSKVDAETLRRLILNKCKEDDAFLIEVLDAFQEGGDERADAVIRMLDSELFEAEDDFGYNYQAEWTVSDALDRATEQAVELSDHEKPETALRILEAVLEKGAPMIEYDEGYVSQSLAEAAEALGAATEQLVAMGLVSTAWTDRLLRLATRPDLQEYSDIGDPLLMSIAPLATKDNKAQFLEIGQEQNGHGDRNEIFACAVLEAADGPDAAHSYMLAHLDVPDFRRQLVREAMEAEDYARAEELCEQAVDSGVPLRTDWLTMLYRAQRMAGDREKQIETAKELALAGKIDYYHVAKELLLETGRWESEYPDFRKALARRVNSLMYLQILAEEKETRLLLAQLRKNPHMVFSYGKILFPEYPEAVAELCEQEVRKAASGANNRSAYRHVGETLEGMAQTGAKSEALALLARIRADNPRRPAMKDELNKAESRIRSGEVHTAGT